MDENVAHQLEQRFQAQNAVNEQLAGQIAEQVQQIAAANQAAQAAQAALQAAQQAGQVAAPQRGAGSSSVRPYLNQKGKHTWDWHTWLYHFENVAGSNAWPDDRKKLALAASIEGPAANLIMDLDLQENADGTPRTYLQLKNAFTSRFVSPAESQLARAVFNSARQNDKEDELEWHSRCRALFRRAYPARAFEGDADLILKFILGLRNRVLAHHVQDGQPDNYTEALLRCQNKRATCELIDGAKYAAEPMDINAIQKNQEEGSELDDFEDLEIAAFGGKQSPSRNKSQGRQNSGRPNNNSNPRRQKFQEKRKQRTERKKANVQCHWCRAKGHYQSQCPKYIYCRLQFLNSEGHDVSQDDLHRARIEIGALEDGTFSPKEDHPYQSAGLIEDGVEMPPSSDDESPEDFQ